MMALDDGGGAETGFDHVGIYGALCQIVHRAEFPALGFKDADELLTDDPALFLRLRHTGQAGQEPVCRVHAHEMERTVGKRGFHLVGFVLPQQAVIHENAGELGADRLREQRGAHRRVHAAGQCQQHPAIANLLSQLCHGAFPKALHRPVTGGMADPRQKVAQHRLSVLRVADLRVELYAVKPAILIGNGRVGAGCAPGDHPEALRYALHIVPVAHPGDARLRNTVKKRAVDGKDSFRFSVLPGRVRLRGHDRAAQTLRHELTAIADAQDWHTQGKNALVHVRGTRFVYAARPTGEDDTDGIKSPDLIKGHRARMYFAVNAALPHAPGDQLVILSTEIKDQNSLHCLLPQKRKFRKRV